MGGSDWAKAYISDKHNLFTNLVLIALFSQPMADTFRELTSRPLFPIGR